MAAVKFVRDLSSTTLVVDGVDMSRIVSEMTLSVKGGDESTLTLAVSAYGPKDIVLEGASLVISDLLMPESVELAIYKHLERKYGQIEVTVFADNSGKFAMRRE